MTSSAITFLLFLVTLIIPAQNVQAQRQLQFGADFGFNDPDVYAMVTSNTDYKQFFKDYNIEYLRFPGGTPTRAFIYTSNALTRQADQQLRQYYSTREKNKEAKGDNEERLQFSDDYYGRFLQFCANNNIKPLVELNTNFYAYNDRLYQVAQFRKQTGGVMLNDDNKALKAFLTAQIKLTHQKFNTVLWELGNEDYFMYDAKTSSQIVRIYVTLIRSLYPQDKIIVPMANAMGDDKNGKKDWNVEFIQNLHSLDLLSQIDYFAPHFYINSKQNINSIADLQQKIPQLDFTQFENLHLSVFPANYHPKFFYTEFAIFLRPRENPSYNTRLHGLLLIYFLMNYYHSTVLKGVIYQSLLGPSPLFYTSTGNKDLEGQVKADEPAVGIIKAIPIEAKAERLFFNNVGDTYVNYIKQGGLNILITKTGGVYTYFIMNVSGQDVTVTKDKFLSVAPATQYTMKTYDFSAFNSKDNTLNPDVKQFLFKDLTSVQLKAQSLIVIK